MRRPLVLDMSNALQPRAHPLSPAAVGQIFGGCVASGGACTSPQDCCQIYVPPGDYVLSFFYRGHGIVSGYCTTSSAVYGS
jgi:hypothetical protein